MQIISAGLGGTFWGFMLIEWAFEKVAEARPFRLFARSQPAAKYRRHANNHTTLGCYINRDVCKEFPGRICALFRRNPFKSTSYGDFSRRIRTKA